MLEVRNLSKSYGSVHAVTDVSFTLRRNEVLALIGPNGAGKSTCFNMLGGQIAPDRGSIRFEGKDMAGLAPHRVWRLGVARTFQVSAAFRSMTVRENVQMALLAHRGQAWSMLRLATRAYREEAMAQLEQVGLADHAGRACSELAYGDVKRLELAVALSSEPKILLLDEPTAGMSAGERASMMALIARLVRDRGLSALFTEHDMDAVFSTAHRVVVMSRGALLAEGAPADIRVNPEVRSIYLGRGHGADAGRSAA